MKITRNLCVAGLFLATAFLQPSIAQSVELTNKDGSPIGRGVLVSVNSKTLVVRTNLGVTSFDRDTVNCLGAACPVTLTDIADMTVAAPAELAEIIMPLFADGFAESQEQEALLLTPDGVPLEEDFLSDQSDGTQAFNIMLSGTKDEPAANIVVNSAGGDRLFDALSAGEASLIFSEETANQAAVSAMRAANGGNLRSFEQERVVAVDGYVAVAHPRNPVHKMTLEQLSDVMSGKIDNWSAFGGPNRAINVYSFGSNTEAFHHIDDLILKPHQASLVSDAQIVNSNRALTVAIEEDQYGFGVVSYSSVRDTRPMAIINECGMIVEPSAFNIKTEEYTLQNRITAYNSNNNNALTADFLEFLESSSLDNLVGKSGLISLSIIREDEGKGRDRLLAAVSGSTTEASSTEIKDLVLDAMTTDRLSTTFRFEPGSSILDNKARRDLARVLHYVKETGPRKLVLAGFADSNGNYWSNKNLSLSRARAVYEQLQAADSEGDLVGIDVVVRGYGELGPVACNETFDGRATNRRVEIWAE